MNIQRCYDELRVRVDTVERKSGSAKSVWGPILEYMMVIVWATLLYPFTYSSTTLFVRDLDGDVLRIILGGHVIRVTTNSRALRRGRAVERCSKFSQ